MGLSLLKLSFSHLNEHKFRQSFNDTVDSMCTCGLEPRTTLHYLLRCNPSSTQRLELRNKISMFPRSIPRNVSNEKVLNILLYGSEYFSYNMNKEILKAKNKFLKRSDCFNGPPFLPFLKKKFPNGTYPSYIF